jgi:hypothetical protein
MTRPLTCTYCDSNWDTWDGLRMHSRSCRRKLKKKSKPLTPEQQARRRVRKRVTERAYEILRRGRAR